MFKKAAPIIILFSTAMISISVYADDALTPQSFQGGIWKGTYSSRYCDKSYEGEVVLQITNVSYDPPSYNLLTFDGSLQFMGDLPDGFSKHSRLTKASMIYSPSITYNGNGNNYTVDLVESTGTNYLGSAQTIPFSPGYSPYNQNIQAYRDYGTSSCGVYINVNPR